MKKNLIVLQDGYKECGPACLLSIIRYFGGNISINKLVEMTYTNKLGTNFYNLKQAANNLGLDSKSFKLSSINDLNNINLPLICQFINKNYEHFIVLYKFENNKFVIMDPALGERTLTKEEFVSMWTSYILVLAPYKKLSIYKEDKYLNKIIKDIIYENKGLVLNILILSLIFTVLSFIYAFYSKIVIDKIINTTTSNLNIITILFSIVILIKVISNYFRNIIIIILNQKIDCSLFINTFNKILLLPYNYYKNKTTGEIITRINDLLMIKNLIGKIILTVFLDFILSLGCLTILFLINIKMFIFTLVIILLYIIIYLVFKNPTKYLTNIIQENNGIINTKLVEYISGFETIKNLFIESNTIEDMERVYTKSLEDVFHYEELISLEIFLKDIVSLFGILLISYYGYRLVLLKYLSIGTVITFISLINFILEPIKNILEISKEYYYAKNSIKRINNLFEIETENHITKTSLNIDGNIRINNLLFSYNNIDNILFNVNLNINKGDKVLLIGKSGSGKSTILKLLYKYYKVNRDMIYIDNIDINDYTISDIRSNIAYISQDETLFTDTIKNNIISNRYIEYTNLLEVCNLTDINNIVKKLYLNYDTTLEEDGKNISGGQRQRIILARSLLKNSKIVLIDEGLNELDISLERDILKKVFNKYKEKTFIIISHRLDNMDLYNKVFTLDNGIIKDLIPLENANN